MSTDVLSEQKITHTPGPLKVVPTSRSRQFRILNESLGGDHEWDDVYVQFSGYFGSYGPHMFAAAPEMLEALKAGLRFIENTESELGITLDSGIAIRAAIAKATGGQP